MWRENQLSKEFYDIILLFCVGTLFEQSLNDGYLNISIVSLMFTGVHSPGCSSAKCIAFQQPLPTAKRPTLLSHHEIFFRAKGDPTLRKIEPDYCDEVVLYSIARDTTVANFDSLHSVQEFGHANFTGVYPTSLSHLTLHPDAQEIPSPNSTQQQSLNTEHSVLLHTERLHAQPVVPTSIFSSKSMNMFSECANTDEFVNSMSHYRNGGTVELYSVFDCGSHFFEIKELLKIFISNLTLSVLVCSGSQSTVSVDTLEENKSNSLKGLVLETHNDAIAPSERFGATQAILHQFSDYLVTDKDMSGSYIFSMNTKEPKKSDFECGRKIVSLSLSLASTERYPFSWYLFGLKLQKIMMTLNRNTLSISGECMIIARELHMNRSAVEAALEHLTEHNILLYFRDILEDVVFSGINIFSNIFSKLISKKFATSITKQDLLESISGDEVVSADSFIYLFQKLMILAPGNDCDSTFIMPCLLSVLSQSEVDKISSSQTPLLIKCPSTGFEYICLLTVYLLQQRCKRKWKILTDTHGNPLCLHKNAVKFFVEGQYNDIVLITFSKGYLKVSASEMLNDTSASVLQGLESIKVVLRCSHTFSFKLAFVCHCGRHSIEHSCTYDKDTMGTICDVDQAVVPLPLKTNIIRWLKNNDQGKLLDGFEIISNTNIGQYLARVSKYQQ